jgi:hypothetical protein
MGMVELLAVVVDLHRYYGAAIVTGGTVVYYVVVAVVVLKVEHPVPVTVVMAVVAVVLGITTPAVLQEQVAALVLF